MTKSWNRFDASASPKLVVESQQVEMKVSFRHAAPTSAAGHDIHP